MHERADELIKKFMFDFPPVAIKFYKEKPEGVKRIEKRLPLCKFVKEAQFAEEKFYVDAKNDACFGKMSLGMIRKPPSGVAALAGIMGAGYGIYGSPMACKKLYENLPSLEPGTVNYIVFCRCGLCDFEPDLVFFFCDARQADIIMRASCYLTGDIWETRSAPVVNCAWMYAYPILSGKVNYMLTSMSQDLKVRKAYPGNLVMIAVPRQKLDEVMQALEIMPWVTLPLRKDKASIDNMQFRRRFFIKMGQLFGSDFDPHKDK